MRYSEFDSKLQGYSKYTALGEGARLQVLNAAWQRVCDYFNAKGRTAFRRDNLTTSGIVIVVNAFRTYRGTLTRNADDDSDPPTVVSEQSSLTQGTPVWTRAEKGILEGTLTGAFPSTKTRVFTGLRAAGVTVESSSYGYRYSDNKVRVETRDPSGALVDGFNPLYVLIEVDP